MLLLHSLIDFLSTYVYVNGQLIIGFPDIGLCVTLKMFLYSVKANVQTSSDEKITIKSSSWVYNFLEQWEWLHSQNLVSPSTIIYTSIILFNALNGALRDSRTILLSHFTFKKMEMPDICTQIRSWAGTCIQGIWFNQKYPKALGNIVYWADIWCENQKGL